MSISDINKKSFPGQIRRTVRNYLCLTAVAVLIDNIYALFGHGVRSPAMYLLFLYPLLGGALVYLLIGRFVPHMGSHEKYRLFYNVHNSGVAILAAGSLLSGILDIAGTASAYVPLFYAVGWIFVLAGLALVFIMKLKP